MAEERDKNAAFGPDRDEPDAPATDDEVAASARLRDALADASIPDEDAMFARALASAFDPKAIAPEAHAALLDELPTAAELAAAEALRDRLARPTATADDDLVVALRAAWSPATLDDAAHAAIVAKALASAPARTTGAQIIAFRPRRASVAAAVTAVLAIAAGVFVFIGSTGEEQPLAKARSTQPLFSEPFKPGEASARIDRIASARASDYRDNRFAKWGVR